MLESHDRIDQGARPTPATPVSINVTPLFKQRNMVVCDIDPPANYEKGGNIKLAQGSYTLEFSLLAGTPANLRFRAKPNGDCDGFWSNADDCPTHDMNDPQYSNPRLANGGSTLLVDVSPSGQPNAIHYRLNFDNQCNFDPIIIHQ